MRSRMLLVFLVLATLVVGCTSEQRRKLTAGKDVVVERSVDAIVEQIGELEVRKKEVENAIEKAEAEIDRLQLVQAESMVDAEILEKKIAELEAQQEAARAQFTKLADAIDAGEAIILEDGTTIAVQELREYADRQMEKYDTRTERIRTLQNSAELLRSTAREAEEKWEDGRSTVDRLHSQTELIDAMILSLRPHAENPSLGGEAYSDAIAEAEELHAKLIDDLEREGLILEQMTRITAPSFDTPIEDYFADSDTATSARLRALANE